MVYFEIATMPLHFLHPESLPELGLVEPPGPGQNGSSGDGETGSPIKKYTTAEVLEKEYCLAKKSKNRFNVPSGTKFYRVKCRRPPPQATSEPEPESEGRPPTTNGGDGEDNGE